MWKSNKEKSWLYLIYTTYFGGILNIHEMLCTNHQYAQSKVMAVLSCCLATGEDLNMGGVRIGRICLVITHIPCFLKVVELEAPSGLFNLGHD